MPDTDLIEQVTRGFTGLRDQIREKDDRLSQLSDRMIAVELKVDLINKTLGKIEGEMSRVENVQLKMRVDQLEVAQKEGRAKQIENGRWIKGLLASVISLLLGFLLNFIRISAR